MKKSGEVTHYNILRASSSRGKSAYEVMIDLVNEAIQKGWQPVGEILRVSVGGHSVLYKEIVKYEI